MKKAGCWIVSLGVESGNEEILKKTKKGITKQDVVEAVNVCKSEGLKSFLFLIIGLPWETKETAIETIDFAKSLDCDFIEYNAAYPFPGTEYAEILEKHNLFKREDIMKYDPSAVGSFRLTPQGIEKILKKALLSFHLRPKYIFKTISNLRNTVELKNFIIHGLKKFWSLCFD